MAGNAADQRFDLGLLETIKEEVGDDQVIAACERDGPGVSVMKGHAAVVCAVLCEAQHAFAEVDGVDFGSLVHLQETLQEPAVAVSEDEDMAEVL